ncbi:hypothetical protein MPSEU_000157100 [Mayamaea pseudoterrestris]|nr:hypothetical protein MPSEU_000157100 [Mayamaea pseudoterrestris]
MSMRLYNRNIRLLLALVASSSLRYDRDRPSYAFAFAPPLSTRKDSIGTRRSHLKLHSVSQRREQLLESMTLALQNATCTNIQQSSSTDDSWISKSFDALSNVATNRQGRPATVIGPDRVLIYDTSLRDGTQGESVSASVDDKLKIAKRLVAFGVDYVEAGWPGSNPKDASFFARSRHELSAAEHAKLVAFGSTRRKNIRASDDLQVQALLESNAPTICIVAKSHAWQVTDILRASLEENVAMISDTIKCLHRDNHRNVMIDLEHFFDGYAHDQVYALQCCQAAVDAGASCLVLCDTNGGSMPWQVAEVCKSVVDQFASQGVTIGIHCHNDCGMAVANSIVAAKNGVGLIQGTINGIGERTGNADLCSIVPALALHVNSSMTCKEQLKGLTSLSRFVDEILNRTPQHSAPFVGASAFAHKGGLHVAAMERSPLSYQHIEPDLVGNEKRILISELAGRQNIMGKIEQAGVHLGEGAVNERATAILNRVKSLEAKGYTFEGADASVHLMILHSTGGYCSPFRVLDYSANVYDNNMDSATRVLMSDDTEGTFANTGSTARATVKVRTMLPPADGLEANSMNQLPYEDHLEVSDGNGPVDALAKALVRALLPSHPSLQSIELIDYKVRILDPESATQASTRVMIEFKDSVTDNTWTTVSVDTNVISASVNALIDGFEFALIEHAESCMLCDDAF